MRHTAKEINEQVETSTPKGRVLWGAGKKKRTEFDPHSRQTTTKPRG
jgi:hypothetical protein